MIGKWQVRGISWSPAKLLMFIRAFSLLETQRSGARKSAIVDAVVFAVSAAGNGLEHKPYRTTSA